MTTPRARLLTCSCHSKTSRRLEMGSGSSFPTTASLGRHYRVNHCSYRLPASKELVSSATHRSHGTTAGFTSCSHLTCASTRCRANGSAGGMASHRGRLLDSATPGPETLCTGRPCASSKRRSKTRARCGHPRSASCLLKATNPQDCWSCSQRLRPPTSAHPRCARASTGLSTCLVVQRRERNLTPLRSAGPRRCPWPSAMAGR